MEDQKRQLRQLCQVYERWCRQQGYVFTDKWFWGNLLLWSQTFASARGKPGLRFLEIGSWEGQSTCWLLDNVLTHAQSTITCIDTFTGSIEHDLQESERIALEARFDDNIVRSGGESRLQKIIGLSQVELRKLPLDHFHFAYIDGSHAAPDVLEDAVLTWRLIQSGGLLILDDYDWPEYRDNPGMHPKPAIDAFLAVFRERIKLVHKGYQVIVQKIEQ